MPLKFDTVERCKEDDCRSDQPTHRSPSYQYEAPGTCYTCHSWHDEFHTTLRSVEVRTGFRWNGGYEEPDRDI